MYDLTHTTFVSLKHKKQLFRHYATIKQGALTPATGESTSPLHSTSRSEVNYELARERASVVETWNWQSGAGRESCLYQGHSPSNFPSIPHNIERAQPVFVLCHWQSINYSLSLSIFNSLPSPLKFSTKNLTATLINK